MLEMNEYFFRRVLRLEAPQANSPKVQKSSFLMTSLHTSKNTKKIIENPEILDPENATNLNPDFSTLQCDFQPSKAPLIKSTFSNRFSQPSQEKKTKSWLGKPASHPGGRGGPSNFPNLTNDSSIFLKKLCKSSSLKDKNQALKPQIKEEASHLSRTPSLSSSISSTSTSNISGSSSLSHTCKNLNNLKGQILFVPPSKKKIFFPRVFQFCEKSRTSIGPMSEIDNFRPEMLPSIILTYTTDEDDYCTVSPFGFDLFCPYTENSAPHMNYLRVPTVTPLKNLANSPKRRQWPHSSGPWLRPVETKKYRIIEENDRNTGATMIWKEGCRLSNGMVVGWTSKIEQSMQQYYFQLRLQKALKKILNAKNGFSHNQKVFAPLNSFPPPRLSSEIEANQKQFLLEQELKSARDIRWQKNLRKY